MICKNCGREIIADPTDVESHVHKVTGDGACDPSIIDAWAEPVIYSENDLIQFKQRIVRTKDAEIYIPSDDPNTEFRKGTRVLYKGRHHGTVTGIDPAFFGPPFLYVTLDSGTVVLAPLHDLQNISDKREG